MRGHFDCIISISGIGVWDEQIYSSRRLEREAQRNIELMWLTNRLAPDFKTIADFRKDNGKAVRRVCTEFVMLCKKLDLFKDAFVAIDGSKFKAVNNRDKNFTQAKMKRRLSDVEASIDRYIDKMANLDEDESAADNGKKVHIETKIVALKWDMMAVRSTTVEHPFGTLKSWMGHTHFLTKALVRVKTEMSFQVLAYNMKRMIRIVGTKSMIEAIQG